MRLRFYTLLFFSLVLALLSFCGRNQDLAGKVGDEVVTVEEFKQALQGQFNKTDLSEISIEDKQKTLEEMLDYRLKILKARELGYHEDSDLMRDVEGREDNLIAQKLYEIEIVDHILPDDVLHLFFDLKQFDIKGVVIIFGYQDASQIKAERSKEEAIKRAKGVLEKLDAGENAEKLAVQYSDDPSTKSRRGVLEPYIPGMFDLSVDMAIHAASENTTVGPVVTDKAIFVVRLNEKRALTGAADFEKEKTQLKKQIYQRFYKEEGNKTYLDLTVKFKERLGWEISDQAIQKFVDIIAEWKVNPNPSEDQFTAEQLSIELGHVGSRKFTVGEFIKQFRGQFNKYYKRYEDVDQIKKSLISQVDYYTWIVTARERGIGDDPLIKNEIERLTRQRLAELLDKYEIRDKVIVSEEEVQESYEKDKEKYVEPRKMEIWEIAVKDEALANRIAWMAKNKTGNFEEMAKKYTEKPARKSRGGYFGFQTDRSELGEMMKKAFEAGPNKILGPMQYGIYYYILKTGEFKPERQKSLEEMRTLVETGIKRDKSNIARKAMMEELHDKYPMWINESLIKTIS